MSSPTAAPTRFEQLKDRLKDPTVTVDEFKECCVLYAETLSKTMPDMELVNLDWYVKDADLLEFWKAVDWWPYNLKGQYVPTLYEMVMASFVSPQRTPDSFMQNLMQRVDNVVKVLERNKTSVVNPNETKEERAARLNRERVARHAKVKKEAAAHAAARETMSPDQLSELDAALAAKQQEIKRLTAEAEAWQERYRQEASHHYAAMCDAAANRKACKTYYDDVIKAAKSAYAQLGGV